MKNPTTTYAIIITTILAAVETTNAEKLQTQRGCEAVGFTQCLEKYNYATLLPVAQSAVMTNCDIFYC